MQMCKLYLKKHIDYEPSYINVMMLSLRRALQRSCFTAQIF
jgi:hypothetical protein